MFVRIKSKTAFAGIFSIFPRKIGVRINASAPERRSSREIGLKSVKSIFEAAAPKGAMASEPRRNGRVSFLMRKCPAFQCDQIMAVEATKAGIKTKKFR